MFLELGRLVKKLRPTIGIDLSSNSIKAVEIKGNLYNLQVVNAYKTVFPPEAVQDGVIIDKELIAKKLGTLVKKFAWKRKQVVTSVGGRKLLIRHFKMPVMPEKELKNALHLELEPFLLSGKQEMVIDYVNLGTIAAEKNKQYLILVAAIPKDIVMDYYEIFRAVDLDLVAIDIAPLALQRALALHEITGVTAFADFAANAITFFILSDGKVTFIRNITLNSKMVRQESVTYQEQVAASSVFSLKNEIIREYDLEVIEELRRSFDLWQFQSMDTAISKLVITGDIVELEKSKFILSRQLGLTVEVRKPFTGLIKEDDLVGPEYALAAGLAIRGVTG